MSAGRQGPQAGLSRQRPPSIRRQNNARLQATKLKALRPLLPKCTATAKGTGEQCRQLAMPNGKCAYHGGRTPKGRDWHRPLWPNADRPDAVEKLNRKLRDLDKARRKRERRVAAMSPEERAAYDRWKRSHKPGSPGERARARAQREQDDALRAFVARNPGTLSPSAVVSPDITSPAATTRPAIEDDFGPYEGAFA